MDAQTNDHLPIGNLANLTCERGWAFDQTEFTRTLPTDQLYVCDNSHYVADLYTYSQAGWIVGGVVFSYIADRFGRKLTFFITTVMISVCMTTKTFLYNYHYAYAILKFLAGACYISTYQLPATLITEISGPSYRTWVIVTTWLAW